MSFHAKVNRTRDGRKKRTEPSKTTEESENFFDKTGRDKSGRKKRKI